MSRLQTRLLVVLLLALLTGTPIVHAEGVSRTTFSVLEAARKQIENGDISGAAGALRELIDSNGARPYDQAIAYQLLAHAQVAADDRPGAIKSLENSLSLEVLPEATRHSVHYNLAQLYLAAGQYTAGVELLKQWLDAEPQPPASARALLGGAYVQLGRYTEAITPLQRAIGQSDEPRENWYQTLLAAHYELKQYADCVSVLETLIREFPARATYWKQLAGVQLLRKRPQEALSVMELAYLNDHLDDESELLQLAALYLQRDAPYKAGTLLSAELKSRRIARTRANLETLAYAWQQAREAERTAHALEEVIALGATGEVRLRLARLYMEQNDWQKAVDTLEALLESGAPPHTPGQTWLLLGIASHESGAEHRATQAFQTAKDFPEVSAAAVDWLNYLGAPD